MIIHTNRINSCIFSLFILCNWAVFLLFYIIYNLGCKVILIVAIVFALETRLSFNLVIMWPGSLYSGAAQARTTHLILPPSPALATSRNQMSLLNIHCGFYCQTRVRAERPASRTDDARLRFQQVESARHGPHGADHRTPTTRLGGWISPSCKECNRIQSHHL